MAWISHCFFAERCALPPLPIFCGKGLGINSAKKKQWDRRVKVTFQPKAWCDEAIINRTAYIDKYNWEGINYPPEKDNLKKFEKNNRKIALLMFCMLKTNFVGPFIYMRMNILFQKSNHMNAIIYIYT